MKTPSQVRVLALVWSVAISLAMVDWIALQFLPPTAQAVSSAMFPGHGGARS